MIKRIFDISSASFGLIIFSPFLIIISLLIVFTSKGGVFFIQQRVGLNNINFGLLKFRTMNIGSEKKGQLTVGTNDNRITSVGKFLRKFKLDEIPQLFNVIKGDMSIVGPRPEVEKYVALYNKKQLKVLNVRPGLTDLASIEYINENEILGKSNNPEHTYITEIMPKKLELNIEYISKSSLFYDIKLILRTIVKLF